jgi:alkaline phosphatase D
MKFPKKAFWIVLPAAALAGAQETRQATGVKIGEVTTESAIVWMRVTADSARKKDGVETRGRTRKPLAAEVRVESLEGEAPGAAGRVRFRYSQREDLGGARGTDWAAVDPARDFTHQFRLTGLTPATKYYYAAETGSPDGKTTHGALRGSFETAPPADRPAEVTFTVITGMMYAHLDDRDGFHIYESMLKVNPKFIVPTGDTVYYDGEDPVATTIPLARYHWHRMYSMQRLIAFHLRVPGYWEKDDHDTLQDDCWPDMPSKLMRPMTFAQGQSIFLEQVPLAGKTYRTYRWGRALQVWLTEGRDYRSPNTMPDGPRKSIWGEEQKGWLKDSILRSDADWKVLVSPTPIVGPDRPNKRDNHSNASFATEGDEFRAWARKNVPENFFVACGDRHWQYHSVHPSSGMHEFSSGPASDLHAEGTPGEDPRYHRFHKVQGGFLAVTVVPKGKGSQITLRLHDVRGRVSYEYSRSR